MAGGKGRNISKPKFRYDRILKKAPKYLQVLPVRGRLATARARLVFSDFLILRFSYFLSSNFQFSEWLMVSSLKIPLSAHNYRVYGTNTCNFLSIRSDSMMVVRQFLRVETRVRVPLLILSGKLG